MLSMSLLSNMFLMGSIAQGIYGAVLLLVGLFLICLILLQRGRGGGLAGAFGGMGGQSAFGSKAGDAFTHFTIVVAAVWIVVCILGTFIGSNSEAEVFSSKAPPTEATDGSSGDSSTTSPGSDTATEAVTDGANADSSATENAASPSTTPSTDGAAVPADTSSNAPNGATNAEGEITSNPSDRPADDATASEPSSAAPPAADATPPK